MEWINVKDRLPEEGQRVIYYFDMCGTHIGKYKKEDGYDCFYGSAGWLCGDVTHWMPLPVPPNK